MEDNFQAPRSNSAFDVNLRAWPSNSTGELDLRGQPSSLFHESIRKVLQDYKSKKCCLALKTFRSPCLCLVDSDSENGNGQQALASSSSMEFNLRAEPASPAFELGPLPWRTTCKLSIPAQYLVSAFELGLRAQPSCAPSQESFALSLRARPSSSAF